MDPKRPLFLMNGILEEQERQIPLFAPKESHPGSQVTAPASHVLFPDESGKSGATVPGMQAEPRKAVSGSPIGKVPAFSPIDFVSNLDSVGGRLYH
ncbi:MAG: hypothetical protein E6230_11610 [Paenibacillus dendritiformis]|uniref:hypothetical protein n=1 Tax=Paenibacillus dendritiformis TaxID=130049 RepID=UPI001B19DE37|nr:hypothetical protein [Paenibacillus dendritiformis]MDU5142827.1 hypothetical protein [Paenibacillus dendritiformis]GIO73546.1 hypothetical protein J27TS7_30600 [Paenibacillus dendritiformis]